MGAIERLSRRRFLKGTLAGSAVTVALPFLECFLDVNGAALASDRPLPTRFVHWFWGNGITAGRQWWPDKVGPLVHQSLGPEMAALESVKDKINILTNLNVQLDGRPNRPHASGWQGLWTGTVPAGGSMTRPSVDTLIADQIGKQTRFMSLGASCTGNASSSMSYRAGGVQQPNEISPAALYARIFGPQFKDPNSADFKPDPRVMAERSVLTAIKDGRQALVRDLGAADRTRVDEYFTSLRQIEMQIELQLAKPAPMAACKKPVAPDEIEVGTEIETVLRTNKLMAELMAHALLCDQTRVAAIMFSDSAPGLRIVGDPTTYHTYSHQEPPSGPQTKCAYFSRRCLEGLATLIQTLESFKEGDGTLLDRTLVLATSDNGHAFTHQVTNIPLLTAGRAGGAIKTGLHIDVRGRPATELPMTAMQIFKVPLNKFGTDSMETSNTISDLLA